MTSVVLSIDVVEMNLPPNTKFDGYRFSMAQRPLAPIASGTLAVLAPVPIPAPAPVPPPLTQKTFDTFATFPDLADGVYDASCSAVATDGLSFGPIVSAVVTVGGAAPVGGVFMAPKGLSYAVG